MLSAAIYLSYSCCHATVSYYSISFRQNEPHVNSRCPTYASELKCHRLVRLLYMPIGLLQSIIGSKAANLPASSGTVK